jgi:hypothetical protein
VRSSLLIQAGQVRHTFQAFAFKCNSYRYTSAAEEAEEARKYFTAAGIDASQLAAPAEEIARWGLYTF